MSQLSQPVDPFGEVNVYKQADGSHDIVASVLMVPDNRGARTNTPRVANLYAIGCGRDVDPAVLRQVANISLMMTDLSPEGFRKFFLWLSASVQSASIKPDAEPGGFDRLPSSVYTPYDPTPRQVFLQARCQKTASRTCCGSPAATVTGVTKQSWGIRSNTSKPMRATTCHRSAVRTWTAALRARSATIPLRAPAHAAPCFAAIATRRQRLSARRAVRN